jgi:hypothetical protein
MDASEARSCGCVQAPRKNASFFHEPDPPGMMRVLRFVSRGAGGKSTFSMTAGGVFLPARLYLGDRQPVVRHNAVPINTTPASQLPCLERLGPRARGGCCLFRVFGVMVQQRRYAYAVPDFRLSGDVRQDRDLLVGHSGGGFDVSLAAVPAGNCHRIRMTRDRTNPYIRPGS